MIRAMLLCTLPLFALAACTQFPDLDHTQTANLQNTEYPALIPIEPILAAAQGPALDPAAEDARLASRLAALRARADRIRGAVLSGTEKQRLESGLR